jgi:predicted  nucleic acid-binding Zn-ribbon protein
MFGNSIRFAAATQTGMSAKFNKRSESTSTTAASLSFESLDVKLEEASTVLEESNDSPIKLEVPSALPGLSLEPHSDNASVLSLAPPDVPPSRPPSQPPPAPSLKPVSGTAETVGLAEAALPGLVDPQKENSMLDELEPYERLEIDQQIKLGGGPVLELASDGEIPESGTTVLDSSVIGLIPPDAQAPAIELGGLSPASSIDAISLAPESEPIQLDSPAIAVEEISESPQPFSQQQPEQVSQSTPQQSNHDEEDLAGELPYLFSGKKAGEVLNSENSALVFAEPVGDAVIPGGVVQSPDTETLKKYLMLREQDVAILSNQLKSARDQISQLEKKLRDELGRSGELDHTVSEHQKRIEEFEKEKALALQGLQSEIDELRFQNKTKSDKARLLESKVNEATEEIERLKERVRSDIRKIRVREKELENKLEIVRKDSEALITARESKIMELKRKIDLLEFNIDLLQDQNAREKENSTQLRERLAKAAQVVRVAGGLLDSQGKAFIEEAISSSEKKASKEAS